MQALERILSILEVVAARADATASLVAEETGLSLSTTSRLMTQLADEQVLARADGGFSVGPRLVQIARAGSDRFDLRALAQPVLDRLRDRVGETTSLHVRVGSQRICVAVSSSRHAVFRVVPIGQALPLLGSATGEVLLSTASNDELRKVVTEIPEQEQAELDERLANIRQHGWSLVSESFSPGVTGIAAPVTDTRGDVVAALSCSGPTQRFTPSVAKSHVDALRQSATEVSLLHARRL